MLPTMYRTICLSLICASVGLQYAAAAERPVKEAYESLATMQGNDYATARNGFLARDDAKDFLQSRINQDPDDWLAYALWQRVTNKELVAAFDRLSSRVQDRLKDRDFGLGLFKPDPYMRGTPPSPRLHPLAVEDVVKRFDWMAELALELEWMLRNPNGRSIGSQFGQLHYFCWGSNIVPVVRGDLQFLYSLRLPQRGAKLFVKEAFKTLDPERMKSWLVYARDHEREPFVRMLAASRVPDEKSAAVLKELSKDDSLLGMLAAFFYAGCDQQYLPFPGRHPFNGPWLAGWARRATPNQIRAARWIFADEGQDPINGLKLPKHIYGSFGFPLLAIGPLIEHHPAMVGVEMKRRYRQFVVEGSIEMFKEALEGYKAREDVGGLRMKQARDTVLSSMLWPKSAAADLKKINTTDRNARGLIAKALEQLGQRTYPTGEDLQAMFGPEKEK